MPVHSSSGQQTLARHEQELVQEKYQENQKRCQGDPISVKRCEYTRAGRLEAEILKGKIWGKRSYLNDNGPCDKVVKRAPLSIC